GIVPETGVRQKGYPQWHRGGTTLVQRMTVMAANKARLPPHLPVFFRPTAATRRNSGAFSSAGKNWHNFSNTPVTRPEIPLRHLSVSNQCRMLTRQPSPRQILHRAD